MGHREAGKADGLRNLIIFMTDLEGAYFTALGTIGIKGPSNDEGMVIIIPINSCRNKGTETNTKLTEPER